MRRILVTLLPLVVITFLVHGPHKVNSEKDASAISYRSQQVPLETLQSLQEAFFTNAVWSPDFQWLAIGSCKNLLLYNSDNFRDPINVTPLNKGCIDRIAFLSSTVMGYNTTLGNVEIWDLTSRNKVAAINLQLEKHDYVLALTFDTEKNFLVATTHEISSWDIKQAAKTNLFSPITADFRGSLSVSFNPIDTTMVAVESPKDAPDVPEYSVVLWNFRTKMQVARLDTQDVAVRSLQFSPDGTLLAVGGYEGKIQIWDLKRRQLKMMYSVGKEEVITSLGFSKDIKYLATGSQTTVTVWDLTKDVKVNNLTIAAHNSPALAFNNIGDSLIIGTDNELQLWHYKE
jgi:WD40 repeat protein